jgi:hypothetical protein
MRYRFAAFFIFGSLLGVSTTYAEFSYQTADGTLNIVAGLSDPLLTGPFSGTPEVAPPSIADQSLTTGVGRLGWGRSGVTLAGSFGSIYFSDQHQIIAISGRPFGLGNLRLLLSDDTYSASLAVTTSPVLRNGMARFEAYAYNDYGGGLYIDAIGPGILMDSYYQLIDVSAYDTNNIGIKGIEFLNLETTQPSLTYVGVAEVVPEPSTYALLIFGAGASICFSFHRRKA